MAKRQIVRRTLLFLFFFALPITLNYYSPVLIIESAFDRTINFSFFFWVGYLVTAFFVGRAACAYVCPLGAAQEMEDSMAPKPLVKVKYLEGVKYLLAVAWVGAIIYGAVSSGGYQRVHLLYNTEAIISLEDIHNVIVYYIVTLVTLLPVFFMGKRAFCRYFCPFSILNIVGSKLALWLKWPFQLHLKASPDKCTQCGTCSRNCQMSLDVRGMVQSGTMQATECILCGQCVDGCKAGAIRYAWKR